MLTVKLVTPAGIVSAPAPNVTPLLIVVSLTA